MTVTQELVAEFIASHLPHLRGQDVAQLSLSDFSTWQVGPDYILRVAFDEDGDAQLRTEAAVMPLIGRRQPVPTPAVTLLGPTSTGFHATGHRKLQGIDGEAQRPASSAWPAIAGQLAGVLNALHTTDPSSPPLSTLQQRRLHVDPEALTLLRPYRELIRRRTPDLVNPLVDEYLEGRVRIPRPAARPVVSHADFKGEHVLLDATASRLVGIIDWADICLADPAVDLAGPGIWLGEDFVRMVAAEYHAPDRDEIVERGLFHQRIYMLQGLGQCLAHENTWPLELVRVQIEWAFR